MDLQSSRKDVLNAEKVLKKSFDDRLNYVIKTNVKKTNRPKILHKGRTKDIYPMSSSKRGFCVIIANYKFSYLSPLKGYSKDLGYLEKVFHQLYFEVRVFENQTGEEIAELFRKYSKSQPVSSDERRLPIPPDAFIGIILSHGNGDSIHGTKHNPNGNKDLISVKKLESILNNKNSPGLKDKPKMLFVQACRGDNEDVGVPNEIYKNPALVVREDVNSQCSMNDVLSLIAQPSFGKTDEPINKIATNDETKTTLILECDNSPTTTDMIVCYSTLSGYASYVFDSGSVFGMALAETLIKDAHNNELSRILSKVSKAVSEEEITTGKTRAQFKKQKQVVNIHQTGWHNQLFFNPGYPKPKLQDSKPKAISNANVSKSTKVLSNSNNGVQDVEQKELKPSISKTSKLKHPVVKKKVKQETKNLEQSTTKKRKTDTIAVSNFSKKTRNDRIRNRNDTKINVKKSVKKKYKQEKIDKYIRQIEKDVSDSPSPNKYVKGTIKSQYSKSAVSKIPKSGSIKEEDAT